MTKALRQPRRKMHGEAIYKVREVTSPIHKDFRGLRILFAIPNMQGHKAFSSAPAPSFQKSYLLFQSSDYSSEELSRKLPQHIRWLLNRGFTKVEPAEEYEARVLAEMAKNPGAQHAIHEETK